MSHIKNIADFMNGILRFCEHLSRWAARDQADARCSCIPDIQPNITYTQHLLPAALSIILTASQSHTLRPYGMASISCAAKLLECSKHMICSCHLIVLSVQSIRIRLKPLQHGVAIAGVDRSAILLQLLCGDDLCNSHVKCHWHSTPSLASREHGKTHMYTLLFAELIPLGLQRKKCSS